MGFMAHSTVTSKGQTTIPSEIRKALHLDSLDPYCNRSIHFVDNLIAAAAVHGDIAVATFDRDFHEFPNVRVNID
jgi:predicted nucleic acid-binding protein